MTQTAKTLHSGTLTLVASTASHVRTELEAPDQFAKLLGAVVSPAWPSGQYDRDAMEFFLLRLEEGGEGAEGWYGWYAIRPQDAEGPRALVGAGGYFGPPDPDGTVEVGYSVLPEWQGRGYASEIVRLLAAHAFSFSGIQRIIAHTTPDNPASMKVLAHCAFQPMGAGAEPGTLRFELARAAGADAWRY